MAENSGIEWTDHTFNPWTGCTKLSPACDHCYAEAWSKRSGIVEWGPRANRRRTSPANWRKPLKWNEQAKAAGQRHRVFCASLADVFDNHKSIDITWRMDLWALINQTPHLDWLLLTKRPQNIEKMLPHPWIAGWRNVWLGTTVENQLEANRRIPELLKNPAAVHFLSCEPLLGPVHLLEHLGTSIRISTRFDPESGQCRDRRSVRPGIDWVITGGESGSRARPAHPNWFRDLRDQCAEAEVPFFFKQWGDWLPWEPDSAPCWKRQDGLVEDGNILFSANMDDDPKWDDGGTDQEFGWVAYQRVGKKAGGRELDGVVHDGYPE